LLKTNLHLYSNLKKGRMFIILLLFLSAGTNAQFFEYGQDAGRLHWSRFKTEHYNVIFPRGIDSLARVFASRLETSYPLVGSALDHRHQVMPVVIHNESSFSNGVFVWAPKRLEIFSNPDPNGYNLDWLTQLALHEGRHAVQIDKLNQGFTRGLYYLGGEQLVGAMAVFLPYWYLEGDAVDAETRLSTSGRGRQPSFEMGLKAQVLESGRVYSFSKATMGSYRHYIPNHYELGYLMVRYGRRKYGDRLWIDFQQYAARKPYLLDPTLFSLRKYGISSKHQFYRSAMEDYREHWTRESVNRTCTPFTDWTGSIGKHYTSYTFPHVIGDRMMFALKSGIDQIPAFVFVGKEGKEQQIFRPGYQSSGRVSFSGNHVAWDEFIPDTRWSNRNYSVIRTFEISTGRVRSLGRRTRYYAPSISGNSQKIVAVEQTENQRYYLVVLGMDGKLLFRAPTPGNQYIQHPAWLEGDSAIVCIMTRGSDKILISYKPSTNTWTELFNGGNDDISHPVVRGNRVFFCGTFSGIDNIYCLKLDTGKAYQVTSARFGAFQPQLSPDGERLFYARYTANGYRIAELPLENGLWIPLEQVRDHGEQMDYDVGLDEAHDGILNPMVDSGSYNIKRYRKLPHLFNLHSWLPLYADYLNPELEMSPEQLPVSLGISLISQNLLSTTVSQVGYEYRNGTHMFHSGIKMKGRYPVLNLYLDYGGEPDVLLLKESADTSMSLPNNLNFLAQAYIPLRLNTGKFLSLVQPRIDYRYRRDLQYIEEEDRYRAGAHYLQYSLYATSYLRKGKKEILPRVGLTASASYFHAPFDRQVIGAASLLSLSGYLPGFLKHQTLKLTFQRQVQYFQDPERPSFITLMNLPRGKQDIHGQSLTRYSADYIFPILYPDLALGPVAYIKRIRGAAWTDYMVGRDVPVTSPSPHLVDRRYLTWGIDLVADLNIFRISFPISTGGRFIYDQDTDDILCQWIFQIEIN
jgi:hypothetical protein